MKGRCQLQRLQEGRCLYDPHNKGNCFEEDDAGGLS